MKRFSLWCSFLLSIFMITSCQKEAFEQSAPLSESRQALFSGSIIRPSLRATATAWESNDQIGIYAVNSGMALTSDYIYNNISNIAYTTTGDGAFTPVTSSEKIMLPGNGDSKDFIAYYPYTETAPDYMYTINVAEQSTPADIDLLYAKASGSKASPHVNFTFTHQLTRIFITLKRASEELDLTDATVVLKNAHTDGTFALADASVTLGSTMGEITTKPENSSNEMAQSSAILVPGQNMNTIEVLITLTDGKTYTWTPADKELESGNSYTFTLKLTAGEKEADIESNTISDWNDQGEVDGGSLDPNEATTPSTAITVNHSTVTFETTGASSEVEVTVEDSKEWTASKSADSDWLTINTESGMGNATVTLTASENTGAERQATVTFTSEGESTTVTVTQKGTTPTTSAHLLFEGAGFEDWTAFENAIGKQSLLKIATQSSNEAKEGSASLHINGNQSRNAYVFSVKAPSGYQAPTKYISFYMKGTASAKSLSTNVYKTSGYATFNLDTQTGGTDVTIEVSSGNQYEGTIDTQGNWVKVTLDISSISSELETREGEEIFAIKVGKDSNYDLYIDQIEAE